MQKTEVQNIIIDSIKSYLATKAEALGNGLSASSVLVRLDGEAPNFIAQLDAGPLDGASKLELQSFVEQNLKKVGVELAVYFKKRQTRTPPKPVARSVVSQKKAFGIERSLTPIAGVKHVVVVASGKGGVGKSTISTNLTVALSQLGYRSGLLDADIYGPSAPTMLGIQHGSMAVNAAQKLIPRESHGIFSMSFGYLTDPSAPAIWRGPMVGKSLRQLCYEVAWPDLDYLVIDLPPGTGDVQLTLIESLPILKALIVTTPQEVAVTDAEKALVMFEKLSIPVAGIVENMSWFCCPCCGEVTDIFGHEGIERLTSTHQQKILLRLPLQPSIRKACDHGVPSATELNSNISELFKELAEKLLDEG